MLVVLKELALGDFVRKFKGGYNAEVKRNEKNTMYDPKRKKNL